jgi:DNA-binding transcriptional regulator YbjK
VTTTTRRDALCDAAIEVIARAGLRGLTHRAVDRAAGVPEGSTSYYFRTRLALLTGVTERLLAVDLADAQSAPRVTAIDLDVMAELATQMVVHWTGAGRERMLARYEVSLESVRHPALRERFLEVGAVLRSQSVQAFAQLGVADAQRVGRDFVAMLDGLIYDQLAGAGGPRSPADLRATIHQLLASLIGPTPLSGRHR